MRAAIGELELDQILHDRVTLNTAIRSTVQEGECIGWGRVEAKRLWRMVFTVQQTWFCGVTHKMSRY